MQDGHQVIGDSHEHVVILFSDIVGFSTMASTMSAVEVFLMLSNLYYAFDRLVDKYGVYKVETIGDGYMLASGSSSLTPTLRSLQHLQTLVIKPAVLKACYICTLPSCMIRSSSEVCVSFLSMR